MGAPLLIRLFACVNTRVVFQVNGFCKGQSADAALIVLFAAV